jgi:hypothetical protein
MSVCRMGRAFAPDRRIFFCPGSLALTFELRATVQAVVRRRTFESMTPC